MSTLFDSAGVDIDPVRPLADRLRPNNLEGVIGQDHLTEDGGAIRRMLAGNRLASLILWGPPGSGKTTLARLLANNVGLYFVEVSAVFTGVADLRKVFAAAHERHVDGQGTLLFVDEIHRFNRSQQDGFLPYVEDGTITLIGATTENPSFELNASLLSRCQVLVLKRLGEDALDELLRKAEIEYGRELPVQPEARKALLSMADGDGRFVLNLAEELLTLKKDIVPLDVAALSETLQRRVPVYDKAQDGHYNLISALHKSLRGSDVDAALYWLARMLSAGEQPLYITRRLVRFAVEDIGLADPQALVQANAAKEAYDFLGSPEGELAIAQAVIYLATAPKSNSAYVALSHANRAAEDAGSLMPPKYILNAPTSLMRDIGYGDGYVYDHGTEHGFSGQNYFPEEMARQNFYRPADRGFEREIAKRMAYWDKLRGNSEEDPGR